MATFSFIPHQAGCHELVTSTSTLPYYYYIYYYTTNLLNSYPNQYFATTSCNNNLLPCYATTVTTTQQQQRPVFFYFNNANIFFQAGLEQQPPAMMTLPPAPAPPPPSLMLSADVFDCTNGLKADDQAAILAPKGIMAGGSSREVRKVSRKAKSVMICTGERRIKREYSKQVDRFQLLDQFECSKTKTTVMIKNIPNKFTRATLVEVLDEHCKKENQKVKQSEGRAQEEKGLLSAYDFVYLPIDFCSKSNKGYAFVNFTDPTAAWKFHLSFNNHKWGVHNSKKICEITYARIQGKEALLKHFQDTVFACETEEFLPLYFEASRDGSGEAVEQRVVGRLM